MPLRISTARVPARLGAVLLAFQFWTVPLATAQFAPIIAYQGYLTDTDGTPLDGDFEFTFQLFDAETDGTTLWTEIHGDVPIEDGIFSVRLGRFAPFAGIPMDQPLFLEVAFGESGEVLSPRVPLAAVPYSLRAGSLDDEAIVAGDNVTIEREGDALRISAAESDDNNEPPSSMAAPDGNPAKAVVVDNEGHVGIGVAANEIAAPLHIRRGSLGLTAGVIENPGLALEASDATVGIYSGNTGVFGSALMLGELVSGTLVDQWNLARETSTGDGFSRLRLSYGSSPDFAKNRSLVTVAPGGFVGIGTDDPEGLLHVSSLGDAELFLEADIENRSAFENRNPSVTLRQDGNQVNAFIALEGAAGARAAGTLPNALVIGSEDDDPALQFVTNDQVRMTIATDGAITAPPRTSVHRIPAPAFIPARSDYIYRGLPEYLRVNEESLTPILFDLPPQTWYAPVQLPDGAVVTTATSNWLDRLSSKALTIRLERAANRITETMAILDTVGSGATESRTDNTIQHAVIDNSRFTYYVRLDFPPLGVSAITLLEFRSVVIDYTTTRIH